MFNSDEPIIINDYIYIYSFILHLHLFFGRFYLKWLTIGEIYNYNITTTTINFDLFLEKQILEEKKLQQ